MLRIEKARRRTQTILPHLFAEWRQRVAIGSVLGDNPYRDKGAKQPVQGRSVRSDFIGKVSCGSRPGA